MKLNIQNLIEIQKVKKTTTWENYSDREVELNWEFNWLKWSYDIQVK